MAKPIIVGYDPNSSDRARRVRTTDRDTLAPWPPVARFAAAPAAVVGRAEPYAGSGELEVAFATGGGAPLDDIAYRLFLGRAAPGSCRRRRWPSSASSRPPS